MQNGDERNSPPAGPAQSGLQVLQEKTRHRITKPGTTERNKTNYGAREWEEYSQKISGRCTCIRLASGPKGATRCLLWYREGRFNPEKASPHPKDKAKTRVINTEGRSVAAPWSWALCEAHSLSRALPAAWPSRAGCLSQLAPARHNSQSQGFQRRYISCVSLMYQH